MNRECGGRGSIYINQESANTLMKMGVSPGLTAYKIIFGDLEMD